MKLINETRFAEIFDTPKLDSPEYSTRRIYVLKLNGAK